jgi:hypothetical protein
MPLHEHLGPLPAGSEPAFRRAQRLHQAWWRTFVLARPPGPYPGRQDRSLCSTMPDPADANFLTPGCARAFAEVLAARGPDAAGMVAEDRARGNLLSSQPMAFNAFGELHQDLDLAARWLRGVVGEPVDAVTAVRFEFRPTAGDIGDNSAFDLAFEYRCPEGPALLGLEVKYTDDFSARRASTRTWYGGPGDRNEPAYREALAEIGEEAFRAPYERMVQSHQHNQLFRNALIAGRARARGAYARVATGLFCHPGDGKALEAGRSFAGCVSEPFHLITLEDHVAGLQRLDLCWSQRAWTMLLWARYLGTPLSAGVLGAR